jgi:aminodeoxychorismate synthase component I
MNVSEKYSSLLLDSGNGWISNSTSAPSYLAFRKPEIVFSSIGHKVTIESNGNANVVNADPLELLDQYLLKGYIAVGYIGYEYSRHTMEGFSPSSHKDGDRFPDIKFLLYNPENVIMGDYENLISPRQLPVMNPKSDPMESRKQQFHACPNMTKYQYVNMVKRAKSYIEQGDIYQVNLSQRLISQFNYDPLEYFHKFYRVQPVPFGSYLDFGVFQLLSGSMELFLRKSGNKLTTNPIKGTIKRGKTEEVDTILKAKLISSDKERAENLMIVDLMRNDLGRVSKPGSIKVNKLFEVEAYSTLHQMVSEVESQVDKNIKPSQIVRSVFPPGSVTGAPKKRTLEVIDELEPHFRGPYCGTIGIFYPNGDFTLSVAIRIMTVQSGKATFFVGGGIVWDSDPEKEFDETILKSQAITKSMGMYNIES